MDILNVLTIIFVIAKLIGLVTWSWWIVFIPLIINVLLTLLNFHVLSKYN